jgi:hypothetical protein
MHDPLSTPESYQAYIYALPERYPSVQQAKLIYIPGGALFGRLEGFLTFPGDVILCVQEFLNFMLGLLFGMGMKYRNQHYRSTALIFLLLLSIAVQTTATKQNSTGTIPFRIHTFLPCKQHTLIISMSHLTSNIIVFLLLGLVLRDRICHFWLRKSNKRS